MSVSIGLGMAAFPFSSARAFWRWVQLCEDGGVDSLWQSDRLVSPEPFLEPMSVMAALAGATERLKFGMNVLVVPFRDPLVLAKQCATIDVLSDGASCRPSASAATSRPSGRPPDARRTGAAHERTRPWS